MLQLVYTSTATEPFGREDTEALCRQAALGNRPVEITGILSMKAGRFLQVLEGPKIAVEDTFIRIIRDTRHHDVMLLSRRLVTSREFGEWNMALCDDLSDHDDVARRVAALTTAAPEAIQRAFADFIAGQPA